MQVESGDWPQRSRHAQRPLGDTQRVGIVAGKIRLVRANVGEKQLDAFAKLGHQRFLGQVVRDQGAGHVEMKQRERGIAGKDGSGAAPFTRGLSLAFQHVKGIAGLGNLTKRQACIGKDEACGATQGHVRRLEIGTGQSGGIFGPTLKVRELRHRNGTLVGVGERLSARLGPSQGKRAVDKWHEDGMRHAKTSRE